MANCFFKLVLTDRNVQVRIFFEGGFEILRFEKFCLYNQFSSNVYCLFVHFAIIQSMLKDSNT